MIMNSNIVTLIVGLTGIIATLIASGLGLYYTARARSSPMRELLYAKQLELISQIIHKQARFRIFATILSGDNPQFVLRAREDIGKCMKDYSELTETAAAILPTDLWVAIRQLDDFMLELLVAYDENETVDKRTMLKLSGMDTKVALISRTVLGVDNLTDESLVLFSTAKDFKRVTRMEAALFERLVRNDDV